MRSVIINKGKFQRNNRMSAPQDLTKDQVIKTSAGQKFIKIEVSCVSGLRAVKDITIYSKILEDV